MLKQISLLFLTVIFSHQIIAQDKKDRKKIKTDSVLIFAIASVLTLLTPFGMDQVGMLQGWIFWLLLCLLVALLPVLAVRWMSAQATQRRSSDRTATHPRK